MVQLPPNHAPIPFLEQYSSLGDGVPQPVCRIQVLSQTHEPFEELGDTQRLNRFLSTILECKTLKRNAYPDCLRYHGERTTLPGFAILGVELLKLVDSLLDGREKFLPSDQSTSDAEGGFKKGSQSIPDIFYNDGSRVCTQRICPSCAT